MNSIPAIERPDSVTHWTCPASPNGSFTHHMLGIANRCAYCRRSSQELRTQQEEIRQQWKGSGSRLSLKLWCENRPSEASEPPDES